MSIINPTSMETVKEILREVKAGGYTYQDSCGILLRGMELAVALLEQVEYLTQNMSVIIEQKEKTE